MQMRKLMEGMEAWEAYRAAQSEQDSHARVEATKATKTATDASAAVKKTGDEIKRLQVKLSASDERINELTKAMKQLQKQQRTYVEDASHVHEMQRRIAALERRAIRSDQSAAPDGQETTATVVKEKARACMSLTAANLAAPRAGSTIPAARG